MSVVRDVVYSLVGTFPSNLDCYKLTISCNIMFHTSINSKMVHFMIINVRILTSQLLYTIYVLNYKILIVNMQVERAF